ncbi:aldo/keto reductase [Methanosarcinaceae archaeon]|nr:aldo/keto reductase [Methanosarcinaceae archaeon]
MSILGFGAMRLPVKGLYADEIDEEKAASMTFEAVEAGVNVIDTAFPYHESDNPDSGFPGGRDPEGGESERFLGRLFSGKYGGPENLRDRILLSTKLPVFRLTSAEDCSRFLDIQLKKLQTDHIDFYLVHSLDKDSWEKVLRFGVLDFLTEARRSGKIRHIGFSFHDEYPLFHEILNAYDWEFCLLQYNYMDTDRQAGIKGLHEAAEKGLGIMVMEPLKGGRLAKEQPYSVQRIMSESGKNRSPAEWALRFVYAEPAVSIVLSGMSEPEQVTENLRIAASVDEVIFTEEDRETVRRIREYYESCSIIGCTGCNYCAPCPSGVAISLNMMFLEDVALYGPTPGVFGDFGWMVPEDVRASKCIGCGLCLDRCPQAIDIPEMMKKAAETFE